MQSSVSGQIIDIFNKKIVGGTITIVDGRIHSIQANDNAPGQFILPGFIDAHIHIESSMLTPYEFARAALSHGTVATVSDPHEIANVCGMEGIHYMIEDAKNARLKFFFGVPSCVPATSFETSGAVIGSKEVDHLLSDDRFLYLAEMMNYPGVLHGDEEVLKKIASAKKYNKCVDGHAPGLRGIEAAAYIAAGITTDHECFTKEEALDKLKHGMKIIIREGSAAKNFEALYSLIDEHPSLIMLCSDDKHPDELMHGHVNLLVKRCMQKGLNLFNVLQAACVNPVLHYQLPVGLLRNGDPADFIIVENLDSFNILQTWINGEKVNDNGNCILPPKKHMLINHFHAAEKKVDDFNVQDLKKDLRIIEAMDGQLITNEFHVSSTLLNDRGVLISNVAEDILKLVVVNRYRDATPACAFIHGFKMKRGAIASTVAHDSHNIIAVGVTDEEICRAVNLVIASNGGLSVVDGSEEHVLPLPIAGLMSDKDCLSTGQAYEALDKKVKQMGCTLRAPYMTLSFMALLVIPSLKLSDKGLFDVNRFCFA